ncbi:hypothetical protein SteCoe_32449 [Stentor coeruleus]|uniref:Uncharacterized protein n=1 Tax=Stentor coeruleus TaxID=5963 RepID=A0A1R2AZ62_9CILI|nr:hypothetical protein SteCoe_32449 [Stentor coeruleus]
MSSESESERISEGGSLWQVFDAISTSEELFEAFNKLDQPISRKLGLIDLITETSAILTFDFSQAFGYFVVEINENDSKDRIDKKNITFEAFKRRIGNFILEKIYNQGEYEKTVKEFIEDNWKLREKKDISGKKGSSRENSESEEENNRKNIESSGSERRDSDRKSSGSEIRDSDRKSRKSSESEIRDSDRKSRKSSASEIRESDRKSRKSSKSASEEQENNKSKLKEIKKSETLSQKKPLIASKIQRSTTNIVKKPDTKMKLEKKNSKISEISDSSKGRSSSGSKKSKHSPKNSDNFGFGLAKAAIKEIRNEINSKKKSNSSSSSSEKRKKSSISESEPKFQKGTTEMIFEELANSVAKPKIQWFTSQIKNREDTFQELFFSSNSGKDFVLSKDIILAFNTTAEELKLEIHDHHREIFRNLTETLHPAKVIAKAGKKMKTVFPRINFTEFAELMNLWGEKYSKEQAKVPGEVIKTIKEYQELETEYLDFSELKSILSVLTTSLSKCLAKHSENHKEQVNLKEKYKKNLEDIFQFYARVQRIQGNDDTFDAMEANNTNLTIGKFLKFCADFNILLNKGDEKRALSKEILTSIFKKTANNTRLMSEQQFIEVIDKVSEIFYSPDLDKQFSTTYAYLPLSEKRELLYKHLGIHDFNIYHHKKKAFGIAFSPEKYSRVPLNDSSHQYKFKINEKSQKKLELWKQSKMARATPPLLKPIPEISKNSNPVMKKSSKILPTNGYALRLKAKKGVFADKKEDRSEIYDEQSEPTAKRIEENKEIKDHHESQTKVITMQALNNLKYKDIDDEYGLKDLISEESDEFFDKLYGIEPKLQGIMKMHDEKLARGQKVIEKSKYALKNQ